MPHYVQWGSLSITLANLVVLGLMIAVFVLFLVLRMPDEAGRAHGKGR